MMIFPRSWLGEGSWSALASVGLVSSRSPNTSLNTLAMWRCCSTQQCSSMDRITGKLCGRREPAQLSRRGEGAGSSGGHPCPSPSLLQALEPGGGLALWACRGRQHPVEDLLALTSQDGDQAGGCAWGGGGEGGGAGGQGGTSGLPTSPLKTNHQEIKPTNLEVTKAWSLMACTTSSNLILVVRVQPW